MTSNNTIKLCGRILISGELEAVTGLHIGGNAVGIDIGGMDNPVIRNALDGQPYIPGSSLKGKLRCLLDRLYNGDRLDKQVAKQRIHMCQSLEEYDTCPVCQLFGVTPEDVKGESMPTRLIFRDARMHQDTVDKLEDSAYADMYLTQVKTEVVIDRITSAATPRQMERVPAGARFHYEIVFNVYRDRDLEWLKYLTEAMDLLEHDYLGGQGSRGYGQVKFATRSVEVKSFNGRDLVADAHVAEFKKACARKEEVKP